MKFDRSVNADLYARAEIVEYWMIDIPGNQVLVHRDPRDGKYQTVMSARSDETISPLAKPDAPVLHGSALGASFGPWPNDLADRANGADHVYRIDLFVPITNEGIPIQFDPSREKFQILSAHCSFHCMNLRPETDADYIARLSRLGPRSS